MSHLNRSRRLSEDVWRAIDEAAVDAARALLTGRRFLELEGPHGLGLTTVEIGADEACHGGQDDQAAAMVGRALSIPMLHRELTLSVRRIHAHQEMGQPLDLSSVEDAAEAVARREEALLYYGQPDFGLHGLLTAPGRHEAKHRDWSKVDSAVDDVITAIDTLDNAGFPGPYALAASPHLYNNLFRRYEHTVMLQVEHLKRLARLGVYKAPIEGAVVVDKRAARIVLGQDLRAGYIDTNGVHHRLFVSESIITLVDEPRAICQLSAKKG